MDTFFALAWLYFFHAFIVTVIVIGGTFVVAIVIGIISDAWRDLTKRF